MIVFTTDIITATITAAEKLVNEKWFSPKILAVINNIIELTIKVNNPNVKIFSGSVNNKRIGLTMIFNIDSTKLANKAV